MSDTDKHEEVASAIAESNATAEETLAAVHSTTADLKQYMTNLALGDIERPENFTEEQWKILYGMANCPYHHMFVS